MQLRQGLPHATPPRECLSIIKHITRTALDLSNSIHVRVCLNSSILVRVRMGTLTVNGTWGWNTFVFHRQISVISNLSLEMVDQMASRKAWEIRSLMPADGSSWRSGSVFLEVV